MFIKLIKQRLRLKKVCVCNVCVCLCVPMRRKRGDTQIILFCSENKKQHSIFHITHIVPWNLKSYSECTIHTQVIKWTASSIDVRRDPDSLPPTIITNRRGTRPLFGMPQFSTVWGEKVSKGNVSSLFSSSVHQLKSRRPDCFLRFFRDGSVYIKQSTFSLA